MSSPPSTDSAAPPPGSVTPAPAPSASPPSSKPSLINGDEDHKVKDVHKYSKVENIKQN